MSNSYTVTMKSFAPARGGDSLLASSISSLSGTAPSRHSRHYSHGGNSMSKIYRQASTLFLTRRLPEALTTLLPLITPLHAADAEDSDAFETASAITIKGAGAPTGIAAAAVAEPAPLASASRTTRVKVWSLYLTILNAILELDPDEGKDAFGTQEWRAIGNKVREGDIWEEVVRNGYHGQEGNVDADVVINLATLLLAHAKSQTLNQKRLESYLSYFHMTPGLDLSSRIDDSMARRPPSRQRSHGRGNSGTDTPRDLNARVKILELYTLHVLLRNGEWDYSREFIAASPILDEERREAFLQALQSLQEDQQQTELREQEERLRQEELRQKELQDARRVRAENEDRERRRIQEEQARRESSASQVSSARTTPRRGNKAPSSTAGSSVKGSGRPKSSRQSPTTASSLPATNGSAAGKGKARESGIAPRTAPETQAGALLRNAWSLVERMGAVFQTTPMGMIRVLVFIVALLTMLGKRNIRERIARIVGGGWAKVKATAGMGVKVSYI